MTEFSEYGRVVVDSIMTPPQFVEVASKWYGGQDCMLYAVCSTGGLKIGTNCPVADYMNCLDRDEKWYLTLWRQLSGDVGRAESAARKVVIEYADNPDDLDDYDEYAADAAVLADYEEWIDNIVIPLLEVSYGLENYDGHDE
jgi:hypothetical protein